MFLPFFKLNLYLCRGQTRFPSASRCPSASIPPAWGHFWVQAKSWLLCLARQIVLPFRLISASPLVLKLILEILSAILCQVGFNGSAIDIFYFPSGMIYCHRNTESANKKIRLCAGIVSGTFPLLH